MQRLRPRHRPRVRSDPFTVDVVFKDPVPVRPDRLIAQGLGLSRNEVLRRVKGEIPLHRPTSTGFTFTVLAGAWQDVTGARDDQ